MFQNKLHMLQNSIPPITPDERQYVVGEQQGLDQLIEWGIGFLRRQYWVILFVAALGIGLGLIFLSIATPIYTAQTSVYIDLHRSSPGQEGIFGNDPIEIESQMEIVKSKAIALSVIKKLGLANSPDSELSRGLISESLGFLFGGTAKPASSDPATLDKLARALQRNLAVERISGSRVITISYSADNPELAARIANAIASAYITDQLEAKYDANRVAANWLQERQLQLREQVNAAQRAVEAFKKQNNIITTDDGKPIDDKQVAELNNRLTAARTQLFDIGARRDRLQTILRLGPSNPNVDGVISDVSSPIVTALRQQYLELARRESEWSGRFGHDHLAVVNLRNRMQEIRQSMFDEVRRSAETANNDYEIAKKRQDDIERQLAEAVAESRATNQVQVTLRGLESTAAGYRSVYDTFVQRYMGVSARSDVSGNRGARHLACLPSTRKKQTEGPACSRAECFWWNWIRCCSRVCARSNGSCFSYDKAARSRPASSLCRSGPARKK